LNGSERATLYPFFYPSAFSSAAKSAVFGYFVPVHDVDVSRELPGEDLLEAGLRDLEHGIESVEALLVSIGAPRLHQLGLSVPEPLPEPELRLYERLSRDSPDGAHSRYNALIRRLVSFERAAECAS
jgi:hypothetical protein